MQSLQSPPFSKLISLLPVPEHSVRVKALNWQAHFANYGLQQEFLNIFGNASEIRLKRDAIQGRSGNDIQKCLEILLWGYPSGMRGNQHLDYLANIQLIATGAASRTCWPDYYDDLNAIGSLGISTVTKIAYFFKRSFGGHQALILDNRIMSVLASGIWSECSNWNRFSYGNAVKYYPDYLEKLAVVAQSIGATPDQVEFFLFSLGDSF